MKRTKARFAALVGIALVFAACGSDGDSGTSADTSATTEASSSETASTGVPDATEAPADTTADTTAAASLDYDPDGTFRFATYGTGAVVQLDPHRNASTAGMNSLALMYDRITLMSPDNVVVPGLAESWEYSEDGLTLTLAIREGATFHDGSPIDAAAVVANLERARTLPESTVAPQLAFVEGVEATDAQTVQITLNRPNSALLALLSDRHGAIANPATFDQLAAGEIVSEAGSGMFRFVEYRDGDRILFERYEDYWDPEAVKVKNFEFVIVADQDARLNALRTGALDGALIDTNQIDTARDAGLDVEVRSGLSMTQIYLNRSVPGLDNKLVRQAMMHALDRQALSEVAEYGYAVPNVQPFPEGDANFNEEYGSDYYGYDPERARELLAEAGYEDGFTFEMLLPGPFGNWPVLAEAMQQMFADVGIEMTIREIDVSASADIFFVQRDGQAMLGLVSGRQDPAILATDFWTSTSPLNTGGTAPAEVEALVNEVVTEIDPETRTGLLQELSGLVTEEALNIILYNSAQAVGHTDNVVVGAPLANHAKWEFRGVAVR